MRLLACLMLCVTSACARAPQAVDPHPGDCAAGGLCDGKTGLCHPEETCSAERPCEDALVGVGRETLREPLRVPECRTREANRPAFDDGAPRAWTDAVSGEARAACVFKPADGKPRPLLIFLHGSGGAANAIYDTTSLRAKAESFGLGGDPAVAGFVLAADQGRNLVSANVNPPAPRHDVYFRDLASPSANPDFRNLDRLVDELVAEGGVDPKRIFLTGWSNGAFFAVAYGLARHEAATPGGNHVAAVAAFDGGDPFQRPQDGLAACDLATYPRSALPVMLVHRSCSIVGCDAAQRSDLDMPPGFDVEGWAETLRAVVGSSVVVDRIVAPDGAQVDACESAARCTKLRGTLAHVRWPDGVADGSGVDHEAAMLQFLHDHPLP